MEGPCGGTSNRKLIAVRSRNRPIANSMPEQLDLRLQPGTRTVRQRPALRNHSNQTIAQNGDGHKAVGEISSVVFRDVERRQYGTHKVGWRQATRRPTGAATAPT